MPLQLSAEAKTVIEINEHDLIALRKVHDEEKDARGAFFRSREQKLREDFLLKVRKMDLEEILDRNNIQYCLETMPSHD
jgi:hypothetical protein